MNSNINRNLELQTEDHLEFFGGEMQPYVDDSTKNYEQKLTHTTSPVISRPIRKLIKISFWRKFAALFSFL